MPTESAKRPVSPWIFWVHAGTRVRVEEGFRTITDAVKLAGGTNPKPTYSQLVYNWLSTSGTAGADHGAG